MLEDLTFRYNVAKKEFLNTNQKRGKKFNHEIWSIRFGTINPNLVFINYKNKYSQRLLLSENLDSYYFEFKNKTYFIPKSELKNKSIIQFKNK
jgi:hypothetical protein